jgi:hypothetical protein
LLASRNDHDRAYDDDSDDNGQHRPDVAKSHRRSSYSGSESSWTDTGDIGEQLADEHDPVRLQLSSDVEDELLANVHRRHPKHGNQKRVRIQDSHHHRHSQSRSALINKEAIEVPNFNPPGPSRAERVLGAIMAGRTGSIHGLTGKALM